MSIRIFNKLPNCIARLVENKMAHHLNLIARKYKMTISSAKTKSMAMWGNHIQRVKIVKTTILLNK